MSESAGRESYEDQLRSCLQNNDADGAEAIARKAFADPNADEHCLGWIAGTLHEAQLQKTIDLLFEFNNRFPESLHPIRVFTSDLYARSGQFDNATHEARLYLRAAKDRGVLVELEKVNIARVGASRAFLLVTAAYTELGARTYSICALEFALTHNITAEMKETIEREVGQLSAELKDPQNLAIDEKWNSLFLSGGSAQELTTLCVDNGFPILAKYVGLIEGKFRYDAGYKIGPESIFDVLIEEQDGSFGLM